MTDLAPPAPTQAPQSRFRPHWWWLVPVAAALAGMLLPILAIYPLRFYIVYFLVFAIVLSLFLDRGLTQLRARRQRSKHHGGNQEQAANHGALPGDKVTVSGPATTLAGAKAACRVLSCTRRTLGPAAPDARRRCAAIRRSRRCSARTPFVRIDGAPLR